MTANECWIELLALHWNTWNRLTAQMNEYCVIELLVVNSKA